ncbi:MAG TPA: amidase, partial [Blastocatellia bacterium]|nr:amidase [Blastocatellia bacterium]
APLPLSSNCNAGRFIESEPPAFCNTNSRELLERILPGFDQATTDFFRWEVEYSAEELGEIVESRLGQGLGPIRKLEPLERGLSGRIKRLRIVGQNNRIVIGKELEIRRALSRSHLYSSAFIVRGLGSETGRVESFRLSGAGWGHGVGLCQIGAAVMADLGKSHEQILAHYFPGSALKRLYM